MTLIATYITRQGIVHASDSNLTGGTDGTGTGRKVFEIPYLNAGLCLSGAFYVRRERMDFWLERFIEEQEHTVGSLAEFSERLRTRLQQEMTSTEKTENSGSMFHVAGYVVDTDGVHPVFYNVRNIGGIDPQTGNYINIGDVFACDEQFWKRDMTDEPGAKSSIDSGGHWVYFNGFPVGRHVFVGVDTMLGQFFQRVWAMPSWKFRPPHTIAERETFSKLHLSVITTLFAASNYREPYIGGAIQACRIAPPGRQKWLGEI